MRPALYGRKIGMTRVLDDQGVAHPVTVIQAGPCVVVQVKTVATDGYNAIQVGFEDVKPHRSTQPIIGHCAKAGTGPKRVVREIRLEDKPQYAPGDVLTVELFDQGEKSDAKRIYYVDVAGVTKGRGFAGVMKRHGFGGQPASHGTERKHRSSGSIGGHAPRGYGPGVKKGRRMAGHMGHVRQTIQNQRLMGVDREDHLLLIRGAVPGPDGGLVLVRQAKKKA